MHIEAQCAAGSLLFRPLFVARAGQRGVSLIEVMVALLIVSFGVLSLARFQSTLLTGHSLAKQRTAAQLLAREKLDSLSAGAETLAAGTFSDTIETGSVTFARSWALEALPGSAWAASTEVSWQDARAQTHYVALDARIAADAARLSALLLAAHGRTKFAGEGTPQEWEPPWTATEPSRTSVPGEADTTPDAQDPQADAGLADDAVHTISGVFVLTGDAQAAGVQIGGRDAQCLAAGGAYQCTVPSGWSGTLTVNPGAGQQASPAQRSYKQVQASVGNENYAVWR